MESITISILTDKGLFNQKEICQIKEYLMDTFGFENYEIDIHQISGKLLHADKILSKTDGD